MTSMCSTTSSRPERQLPDSEGAVEGTGVGMDAHKGGVCGALLLTKIESMSGCWRLQGLARTSHNGDMLCGKNNSA